VWDKRRFDRHKFVNRRIAIVATSTPLSAKISSNCGDNPAITYFPANLANPNRPSPLVITCRILFHFRRLSVQWADAQEEKQNRRSSGSRRIRRGGPAGFKRPGKTRERCSTGARQKGARCWMTDRRNAMAPRPSQGRYRFQPTRQPKKTPSYFSRGVFGWQAGSTGDTWIFSPLSTS